MDEMVPSAPGDVLAARTRVRATFAAYLRLDVIEDMMFPTSTAFRYVAVFVPVFMYMFQVEFLHARAQYTATLVGISVAAALQDALSGFTTRLQIAQADKKLIFHRKILRQRCGRSSGKRMTSRIDAEFVSNMTRRSMPTPSPAAGGIPYSSARM